MATPVLGLNVVDGGTPQAYEFNIGSVTPHGVAFGALETGTNPTYGNHQNRIAVFGGDEDTWVAAVGPGIYRSTDAGATWVQVHTFAIPNADTTRKTGIHVVVVDGVPTAVVLYGTNAGDAVWRAVTSTDGVTWTESPNLTASAGVPSAPFRIKAQIVYRDSVYFIIQADNTSGSRLYAYDVRASTLSSADTSALPGGPAYAGNNCGFAVLDDKLYFSHNSRPSGSQPFAQRVILVSGIGLSEFVTSLPGHQNTVANQAAGHGDMFAYNGKLYVLSNCNSGSSPGWQFHSITSAGAVSNITAAVRPPGMAGWNSGSRVQVLIDTPAVPGGEPTIYVLHSTGPGQAWTVYRWNGEAAVMTNVGSGGNSNHALGLAKRSEGTYFWTPGQRRIQIVSRTKVAGGIRFGFKLWSPNASPDLATVRGFYGAATDEYATREATLMNPSAGNLVGNTVTNLDAADDGTTTFFVTWMASTDGVAGTRAKFVLELL